MIRFVSEQDGILYMITDYRQVDGKIQYCKKGCWKFPYKTTKK